MYQPFIDIEVPFGTIDGVNTVFTLDNAPNPPGSLILVLNGLVQLQNASPIITVNGVPATIDSDYTVTVNGQIASAPIVDITVNGMELFSSLIPIVYVNNQLTAFDSYTVSVNNAPVSDSSNISWFVNSILSASSLKITSSSDYTLNDNVITFKIPPPLDSVMKAWYRISIPNLPPAGSDYSYTHFEDNNTMLGVQDGINSMFNLLFTPTVGTFIVKNGLVLQPIIDYTISGSTLAFTIAPIASDRIRIWTQRAGSDATYVGVREINEQLVGTGPTFNLHYTPNPPRSVLLTKNGMVLEINNDFSVYNNVVTLHIPFTGSDSLRATYRYTLFPSLRFDNTWKGDLTGYIRYWLNDINGKLWDDITIRRFVDQCEAEEVTSRYDLTWTKFSIPTIAGQATYEFPLNVKAITRITWLGFYVDMLTQRQLALLSPVYRTQISKPRWASLQFEGYYQFRLYPVPNQSLPVLSNSQSIYTDTNLLSECQISAYVYADQQDAHITLPDYMALRTIRYFVLYKCFAMEGLGQDEDVSLYWKGRFEKQMNMNKVMLDKLYSNKERQYTDVAIQRPWKKHPPILPPNFGTTVDYF